MANPTKQEIEAVFSRLRSQAANKACFDCAAKAPTWSSVTYGVFICIDCSAVHRSLGVHLTFVRSTNLDTNWTWVQLRQMQLGGNANAAQFFRQHNCNTTDAQQKYNSRAAQLYRDKLSTSAQQAMRIHGTKLYLDGQAEKTEANDNAKEDEDFFAQCHNDGFTADNNNIESNNGKFDNSLKSSAANLTAADKQPTVDLTNTANLGGAPSVDYLHSVVPSTAGGSSIGVRKIQPKKSSGLGARKMGGLGATKVKTDFAEIEHRANMAQQLKDSPAVAAVPDKPMTAQEEMESVASMRLAYQDLSMKKTQEENKLKSIDPMKAKQMERLGMGFNLKGADNISHSAISDMETIKQAPVPKSSYNSSSSSSTLSKLTAFDNDNFFNDYSTSMYSGGGGGSGGNSNSNSTAGGFGSANNTASKLDKQELEMMGFETIESSHSNITSMFNANDDDSQRNRSNNKKPPPTNSMSHSSSMSLSSSNSNSSPYDNSYSRKSMSSSKSMQSKPNNYGGDDDNVAQRKFGSSKGFGSQQYFNDAPGASDNSSNLSRFQGSKSISSADYFGDGSSQSGGARGPGYNTGVVNFNAPDLDDVKESVRQGVHKVAGRISNLANDVMSSLQDKYGY